MLTPIIMAGGSGTRLWPLSRKKEPKQIHPLFDDETLLQKTAGRLIRGFGAERLWITTNADYASRVRAELPKFKRNHFSIEPARRETAPALGLALIRIIKEDPNAVVVYSNSDNFIKDEREFVRILKVAEGLVRAEPDRIALIGVRPTYPETGYGYIRMGDLAARVKRGRGRGEDEIFSVRQFVEKPDLKTAKRYVQSWEYLWNPTLIVARAVNLLDKYRKHLPECYSALKKIEAALGGRNEDGVLRREYPQIKPIAIDYGLLEKEKGMVVIPAAFGWTDIGSWRSVHEILAEAPSKTVGRGPHVELDSGGNLILSNAGRLVALLGMRDTVVIDTADAVLVCPKNRAQEVKKLVEELARKKFENYS